MTVRKMNHHRALDPPAQLQMLQHRPSPFSKENSQTRAFQQLELEAGAQAENSRDRQQLHFCQSQPEQPKTPSLLTCHVTASTCTQ